LDSIPRIHQGLALATLTRLTLPRLDSKRATSSVLMPAL
jgi:hypothetical protein